MIFFKRIILNFEDEELKIVISLILGIPPSDTPKEKLFMWQIVANKTNSIDVDKFDYMSRFIDSYFFLNIVKGYSQWKFASWLSI